MKQLIRVFNLIFRGVWQSTFEGIPYTRKGLKFWARFNILLQNLSNRLRLKISLGIPYCITVEPASICNLSCPVCPSGLKKIKRSPTLLPLKAFKELIDDIGDHLVLIQLWEWGEPFLNVDIYEMIAYAKQKGIIVISSTNCHFFSEMKTAQKLIESGLDGLILAVDGATEDSYTRYRVGGDFSEVLLGIQNVVMARKEVKSKSPILLLRMVINIFNEGEINQYKELAKELGVDGYSFKTINIGMGGEEKDLSILPSDKKLARGRVSVGFKYKCQVPWCKPTLFSNGKIGLCGLSAFGQSEIEAIDSANSFRMIWNNAAAQAFRRNIAVDYNYYDFCQHCDCREPDFNRCRTAPIMLSDN